MSSVLWLWWNIWRLVYNLREKCTNCLSGPVCETMGWVRVSIKGGIHHDTISPAILSRHRGQRPIDTNTSTHTHNKHTHTYTRVTVHWTECTHPDPSVTAWHTALLKSCLPTNCRGYNWCTCHFPTTIAVHRFQLFCHWAKIVWAKRLSKVIFCTMGHQQCTRGNETFSQFSVIVLIAII